jgi:hypothetical protein
MEHYVWAIFAVVLAVLSVSAAGAPPKTPASQPAPLRVLFIGNSFVYSNDLPHQLQVLAAGDKGGRPMEVKSVVHGGWFWQQHVDDGGAAKEIAASKWDFVVLQDNSGSPLTSKDKMFKAGHVLADLVAKSGAKTVLMLTWCRKAQLDQQPKITSAYRDLGQELGVLVAPAGEAWAKVRQARPTIELYNPDAHHPSAVGTYLTACVIYQTLTGRTPVGLPVQAAPVKGTTPKLELSPEDAAFLQKTAAETTLPSATSAPAPK